MTYLKNVCFHRGVANPICLDHADLYTRIYFHKYLSWPKQNTCTLYNKLGDLFIVFCTDNIYVIGAVSDRNAETSLGVLDCISLQTFLVYNMSYCERSIKSFLILRRCRVKQKNEINLLLSYFRPR